MQKDDSGKGNLNSSKALRLYHSTDQTSFEETETCNSENLTDSRDTEIQGHFITIPDKEEEEVDLEQTNFGDLSFFEDDPDNSLAKLIADSVNLKTAIPLPPINNRENFFANNLNSSKAISASKEIIEKPNEMSKISVPEDITQAEIEMIIRARANNGAPIVSNNNNLETTLNAIMNRTSTNARSDWYSYHEAFEMAADKTTVSLDPFDNFKIKSIISSDAFECVSQSKTLEKLSRMNYRQWSDQMKSIIGLKAFDICIRTDDYTKVNVIEVHRDSCFKQILMPSLSSSVINYAHGLDSGRLIWKKLKDEICPGDYATYFRKMNNIKLMRLSEDEDLAQFIARLDERLNNLIDIAPDPTTVNDSFKLQCLMSAITNHSRYGITVSIHHLTPLASKTYNNLKESLLNIHQAVTQSNEDENKAMKSIHARTGRRPIHRVQHQTVRKRSLSPMKDFQVENGKIACGRCFKRLTMKDAVGHSMREKVCPLYPKCHICGSKNHKEEFCNNFKKNDHDDSRSDSRFKSVRSQVSYANTAVNSHLEFYLPLRFNLFDQEFFQDCSYCFFSHDINEEFILDSGSTYHNINNGENFQSLVESKKAITIANGDTISVKGVGTYRIKVVYDHDKSNINEWLLQDCQYVPHISKNLLSVHKLTKMFKFIMFCDKYAYAIDNENNQFLIATYRNGCYILNSFSNVAFMASVKENRCIHLWHKILAHRNFDDIKSLKNVIRIIKCDCKDECEACQFGKQTKNVYHKISKSKPLTEKLQVISVDLCGPMSIQSIDKKLYFLNVIDNYNGYCWVKIIRNKSDTAQEIKNLLAFFKNQFGRYMKILRMDLGTEFTCDKTKSLLYENGIIAQFACKDSSNQNSKVERKHRTLMDAARTMMFESGLPSYLWSYAVKYACHIQNMMPYSSKKIIPCEDMFNLQPNYDDFKIFGCDVFVLIPQKDRNKLSKHCVKSKFIGYDCELMGTCCFDGKSVKISHDVKFSINDITTEKSNEKLFYEKFSDVDKNQIVYICDDTPSESCFETCSEILNLIEHKQFDEAQKLANVNKRHEIKVRNFDANESNLCIDKNYSFYPCQNHLINIDTNELDNPNLVYCTLSKNLRREIQFCNFCFSAISTINELELDTCNICFSTSEPTFYEPKSYSDALKCKDVSLWKEAMNSELQSLWNMNTWSIVDKPKDVKCVSNKWVFKIKVIKGVVEKYKARLVAKGFSQKYGTDYFEVFAPVGRPETLKLLLNIASERKYKLAQFDVQTAFLNGELNETIYMKAPEGMELDNNKVLLLNKSLYGLKQAARAWHQTFKNALFQHGCKQSKSDPCLFTLSNHKGVCYFLIHVDDIITCYDTDEIINDLKNALCTNFKITMSSDVTSFLNISIFKDNEGNYSISQEFYIKELVKRFNVSLKNQRMPMSPNYATARTTELNADKFIPTNTDYRSIVGGISYIANHTRPDINIASSLLSRVLEKPLEIDWREAIKCVAYLRDTSNKKLHLYKSITNKNNTEIVAFCDSDFGEQQGRKSQSGYLIFRNTGIILWKSKRQSIVAQSTTEAEYISMSECLRDMLWIKNLCIDFKIWIKDMEIFCDSKTARSICEGCETQRCKHIDIKYHFIKDHFEKKNVDITYVNTEENAADMLTKPLSFVKLQKFSDMAGLKNITNE
jgi:hypothetical protein